MNRECEKEGLHTVEDGTEKRPSEYLALPKMTPLELLDEIEVGVFATEMAEKRSLEETYNLMSQIKNSRQEACFEI
jgi:hypothetical protein